MQSVYFLLAGLSAGICSGFFGIGGGVILVPILVLLFHFQQHTANGISLVALLLPVGALGAIEYYRAGKITTQHLGIGLLIALGIFLGAFLGSRLAIRFDAIILRKLFAVLLVFLAARMWFLR